MLVQFGHGAPTIVAQVAWHVPFTHTRLSPQLSYAPFASVV